MKMSGGIFSHIISVLWEGHEEKKYCTLFNGSHYIKGERFLIVRIKERIFFA